MPGRAYSALAPETIAPWGGWAIEAKPFDQWCWMIVAQAGHWAIDCPATPRTQPFMVPVTAHDEIRGHIAGWPARFPITARGLVHGVLPRGAPPPSARRLMGACCLRVRGAPWRRHQTSLW